MKSRPTIKDVAVRAGVSRQTVSRVINDKSEISPETRARVLAVIEELGYRPNAAARSMVAGRTCVLGCISPNLVDYTFASMKTPRWKHAIRAILFSPAAPHPKPRPSTRTGFDPRPSHRTGLARASTPETVKGAVDRVIALEAIRGGDGLLPAWCQSARLGATNGLDS